MTEPMTEADWNEVGTLLAIVGKEMPNTARDLRATLDRLRAENAALTLKVAPRKKPIDFLTVEQRFRLNEACRVFKESFDFGVYMVGSVMDRADFRDVDVRAIVADETFAKLYPTADPKNPLHDSYYALAMASFSLYLRDATGLPVDFQVQQQTAANEEFPGKRNALGLKRPLPQPPKGSNDGE